MRKTKICQGCNAEFLEYQMIDGKKRSLSARKFCLTCSPYGSYAQTKKPVIDGKKECPECKEWKDLSLFRLCPKRKRYASTCRVCDGNRATEYGRETKAKGIAYLGGACACCGYSRSLASLHFHHVEPEKKGFAIAKFKCRKWDTVRPELDKCLLLCANCHGELHEGTITLLLM